MRTILFVILFCGCGGAIDTIPDDAGACAEGVRNDAGVCVVFVFGGPK